MKILDKLEAAHIKNKKSITIMPKEYQDLIMSLFVGQDFFNGSVSFEEINQGYYGVYKKTLHIYVSKPL